MKTFEFFELLQDNQSLNLKIEYQPGKFVDHGYHITEVKHMRIEAVDCGSRSDSWNETLIQLWENPEQKEKENLSVGKALNILKKVGDIRSYDLQAEIKFEYGNDHFHISQLFIDDYLKSDRDLILILSLDKTDCKAKDTCVEELVEAGSEQNNPCCAPDGNCC